MTTSENEKLRPGAGYQEPAGPSICSSETWRWTICQIGWRHCCRSRARTWCPLRSVTRM